MIVDGLGRCYVGDLGFDLPPTADHGAVGRIILVQPDGEMRVVADGLRFPNGIAVSADHSRLVVAEMDGGCLTDYKIAADGGLNSPRRFGAMKAPTAFAWIATARCGSRPTKKMLSCGSTATDGSNSGSRCRDAARLPVRLAGRNGGRCFA
jgi:sugar lactone lactonase YvrE